MMQDNTEIVGRWLKKRLLRKHSEAWAIECERALWVLGNCMGDKDVSQIAKFFGCSETDILDVMTTIAVCQCPDS